MNRILAPVSEYYRHHSGLYLPGKPRPTCIDLFCGCGGFSLGMIEGGFEVVAACDNDPYATITYLYNLGTYPVQIHFVEPEDRKRLEQAIVQCIKKKDGVYQMPVSGANRQPDVPGVGHFWFGDIRKVTGQEILDALGMKPGEIDCVVGSPPCQGFSYAGRRNVMDPRNSLVFEFARLVLEIQPKAIIMENVPGILTMTTPEGLPVIDVLCRILEDGGFGTAETIKRSLLATSGAGAALNRGKTKETKVDKPKTQAAIQATEECEQLQFSF